METQSDCSNATSTSQKSKWRVTNGAEYDRALVQRGNLTMWIDEEFVRNHWRPAPSGKKGAPMKYSDRAIQVLLQGKRI